MPSRTTIAIAVSSITVAASAVVAGAAVSHSSLLDRAEPAAAPATTAAPPTTATDDARATSAPTVTVTTSSAAPAPALRSAALVDDHGHDADDAGGAEKAEKAAPAADAAPQTFTATGGSVTVVVNAGRLQLVAATPNPGFAVAARESDGHEVEIRFASSGLRSTLQVELDDGRLEVRREDVPVQAPTTARPSVTTVRPDDDHGTRTDDDASSTRTRTRSSDD